MKKFSYLMAAIFAYFLFSSKSCTERNDGLRNQEKELMELRQEVRNEFESENPDKKSLFAFEAKAKQKVVDLADYLNILTDSSMDISFRKQSKEMIRELFIQDSFSVNLHLSNSLKGKSKSLNAYLQDLPESTTHSILLDSIQVVEPLHFSSGSLYRGKLIISRKIKNKISGDIISSTPVSVDFYAAKVAKSFGGDTLRVWNVSLGTIQ